MLRFLLSCQLVMVLCPLLLPKYPDVEKFTGLLIPLQPSMDYVPLPTVKNKPSKKPASGNGCDCSETWQLSGLFFGQE